jgi:hypothetical protein
MRQEIEAKTRMVRETITDEKAALEKRLAQ